MRALIILVPRAHLHDDEDEALLGEGELTPPYVVE